VSLQVRTTPEADAQIREIDSWWRRNRPVSPNLFADELEIAFDTIGHAPHIGRLYRQSTVPETRRVLLKRTRFHVYYVVPRADEVRVLAVWHAQRGVGPPLRSS
jgi:plasmid stabilization system protein ParE